MKLWLLRRRMGWYDEAHGFVVAANTARQARQVAAKGHGDEGADVWLDPAYVSCSAIRLGVTPRVILSDYKAG